MPDFESLNRVTARLADLREETRRNAVKAIRRLERAFADALGGKPLQGLPNLNPGGRGADRAVWHGLRVRTRHLDEPLSSRYPEAGWTRPALCLDRAGRLCMVSRNRSRDVGSRPVSDDELRAEDLPAVAAVFVEAADLHTDHAASRTAKFAAVKKLADSINTLLEERE